MRLSSRQDGQVWPEASPSGAQGTLLDTGWDIHWPGPGRLYLSEDDLREVLTTEGVLSLPLVALALSQRGWTPTPTFDAKVAELEQQIAALNDANEALRTENDGMHVAFARIAEATKQLHADDPPVVEDQPQDDVPAAAGAGN